MGSSLQNVSRSPFFLLSPQRGRNPPSPPTPRAAAPLLLRRIEAHGRLRRPVLSILAQSYVPTRSIEAGIDAVAFVGRRCGNGRRRRLRRPYGLSRRSAASPRRTPADPRDPSLPSVLGRAERPRPSSPARPWRRLRHADAPRAHCQLLTIFFQKKKQLKAEKFISSNPPSSKSQIIYQNLWKN